MDLEHRIARLWIVRRDDLAGAAPWHLAARAAEIVGSMIEELGPYYAIHAGIAVHRTAMVEGGAVLKPPTIIGPGSFVAATAYLRGGVFLDEGCTIGPACEVKSSFVFASTTIAHVSYAGDSVIGSDVNVEAGAIIANHHNDRPDRRIHVLDGARVIDTGLEKFGALIGDGSRIGANAVLAPGTILDAGSVVPRLALVDQTTGIGALPG